MPEKINLPQILSDKDFDNVFESSFWVLIAREICKRHQTAFNKISRLSSSDHIVFSIDDSLVLKIFRPFRNCFKREIAALQFIENKTDFVTPKICQTGQFESLEYALITQLQGDYITRNDWLKISPPEQISFIAKLAKGLKQIHELNAESFKNDWAEFVENRAETFVERQIKHGVNDKIIRVLPKFIEENLKLVPKNPSPVFMHGDVHLGNLRVKNINGKIEITGLFDFSDSRCGFYEYDFLAVGVLIIQGQKEIQREFFKAYGYAEKDLDETMRKRLMMLTMLYESADLRRYALRLNPEAVDYDLDKLEQGIWSFL